MAIEEQDYRGGMRSGTFECHICGNTGRLCGAPHRCPWASMAALAKRPVAWRVKDYADGWIIYQDEEAAYKDAEARGALMQGLYVRDGT